MSSSTLAERDQKDPLDQAYVRGAQLAAIDRLIPPMMVTNIICAGGLVLLLAGRNGTAPALWFFVISALSIVRLKQAIRSNTSGVRPASVRNLVRAVIQAGVSAACFTSLPAWLLTQTSGMTFTIVVCHLTGTLWAGSLVLNTVVPAAITFTAVAAAFIATGLLTTTWDSEHAYLVLLFLAGGSTALGSVFKQSRLFFDSQHQQRDLMRQGDLIGLLLKDYEEQTSDWLWETTDALQVRDPSPRFLQALKRPLQEVEGIAFLHVLAAPEIDDNGAALQNLQQVIDAGRSFRDHIVPFASSGTPLWWSLSGRPVNDGHGRFLGYRGVATDVTEAKRAEARIVHLAHHDALTGLPNRSFFCSSLDRALQMSATSKLAVLCVDLDGFKVVNDRYGHPVGDGLLIAVAERLRALAPNGAFVARFGGDEFAIVAPDAGGVGDIESLCQRLTDSIDEPFEISGDIVTVGSSIGVAFAPLDGNTAEELLKNADSALYRAKAGGRGTFRFFEGEMDRLVQERQRLIQDLRASLARKELILHYQPFVSSRTGCVTGYEALIRWIHPTRGLVSPCDFIPLAEESGLIGPIGTWVIGDACHEAAKWPTGQRVSVNISPVQFRNRNLPQIILAALTQSGLSPSRLEVEVTEAVLIEDAEGALDILRRIRAIGVRIALDDFGTGYSSLSYLRRFPFDKIKIDQSFVQQIGSKKDSQVIVQAISDIAKGLGMTITAEGVETLGQAEQLRLTGCEELQGYYFSRPKHPAEVDHKLLIDAFVHDQGQASFVFRPGVDDGRLTGTGR